VNIKNGIYQDDTSHSFVFVFFSTNIIDAIKDLIDCNVLINFVATTFPERICE